MSVIDANGHTIMEKEEENFLHTHVKKCGFNV